MSAEESGGRQTESAAAILSETKRLLDEINEHAHGQMEKCRAGKPFDANADEWAEAFYRTDMWPLLAKIKTAAGNDYAAYKMASEMHAEAMFSLGELYMQSEKFARAVGMYSMAVNLTDGRSPVAIKCAKALEAARAVCEQGDSEKSWEEAAVPAPAPEEKQAYSLLEMMKWAFVGFCFMILCIWGALFLFSDLFER